MKKCYQSCKDKWWACTQSSKTKRVSYSFMWTSSSPKSKETCWTGGATSLKLPLDFQGKFTSPLLILNKLWLFMVWSLSLCWKFLSIWREAKKSSGTIEKKKRDSKGGSVLSKITYGSQHKTKVIKVCKMIATVKLLISNTKIRCSER